MLKCQRDKFFLQRKHAYINCAYMSPLMKKVENAGRKGMALKRTPFKIGHDEFFKEAEGVRLIFSQLLNAPNSNRAVIIPSVSYGMANVANNLHKSKGEIVIVSEQFPSNVYPWKSLVASGYQLKVVDPGTDKMQKGLEWNRRILESINEQTVLVAIGHVHWADGTLFDLLAIRKRLDEVDGLLIIDGTQSVGALPFDVSVIRPDALICAAYKWLMGPYGIGLAYYGERFDHGQPIEQNWINRENSHNFRELVNYQENYLPDALRYEVGERSNFILLPMVKAALKEIRKWQPERIQAYCEALTQSFIEEVQTLGFEMEDEAFRSKHLFGLRLPYGVSGERALKVFHQRKLSVSLRGDAIRVSPHVYNDARDVNKLMSALQELVK